MRIRIIGLVVTLCFFAVKAEAQAAQYQWNQNNVVSAAQAQVFEYRIYLTPAGATTSNAPILLTGVTCTGVPPTVNCVTNVPATLNAALITGAKSEITAKEASSVESPRSPFTSGASAPGTFRITP